MTISGWSSFVLGEHLGWWCIKGMFLVHFSFLIHINGLSDDLSPNPKSFGDAASLFSEVRDINLTAKDLNDDLQKIRIWTYEWKMSFVRDFLKEARKVIMFYRKGTKASHSVLLFKNNPVQESLSQNYLGAAN